MDSLKEYREMGFFPLQLNIIEKALRSHVDRSLVRKYIINTSLDNLQMEVILNGLIHELNVDLYCHPDIPYEQMQDVYLKLLEDKQKEISANEMETVKQKTIHVSKTAFYAFISLSLVAIAFILYIVVYPIYLAQHENLEINFKEDHIKINYKDSFNVLENIESYTNPESYKLLYNQPSLEQLGSQQVEVTLSNGFKSITNSFTLEIIDNLKPILSLKKQTERLYQKEIDGFNCKDYIDSVSDNYDNQLMDLVTCKLDNQEIGEHEIVYTIKDSSNNTTIKTLILIIEENPRSTPKPNTEGNFASSSQNNQNNSSNNSSANQSQTQSSAPTNSYSPFIAGVGDIRVSVDSDLGDLVFRLTSNITASGSVSVDYSAVNLSTSGSYPVYYRSSDGASATVTVHVN